MDNNLWLYYNTREQQYAAYSLIMFGAENFNKAHIIQKLAQLEANNKLSQVGTDYDRVNFAIEFVSDYLIDTIRILIFFEGYMKAELIKADFCVHHLADQGACAGLKALAKEQKKRPILLSEIAPFSPFKTDALNRTVTNSCIRSTTLGVNVLLGPNYRTHYKFDDFIAEAIQEFSQTRNALHLHMSIRFDLSDLLIERLKRIKAFVDASHKAYTNP